MLTHAQLDPNTLSPLVSNRILVCGSRDFKPESRIVSRIGQLPRGTTVIHGDARGADRIAARVAESLGMEVEAYPADWKRLGRRAGIERNLLMLDGADPDRVIAFWDGKSRGTAHTIREAEKRGLPVEVVHGH